MATRKEELERKKGEASDLESLLREVNEINPDILRMQQGTDEMPDIRRSGYLDFVKVKENALLEATTRISSITHFYLPDVLLTDKDLVTKMHSHIKSLSSNFLQLEIAEHALIKLAEEIDAGNTHPRQFEVLAGLQRVMSDLTTSMTRLEIQFENEYKIILQDWQVKKAAIDREKKESDPDFQIEVGSSPNGMRRGRGNKELLKQLHREGNLRNDRPGEGIIDEEEEA